MLTTTFTKTIKAPPEHRQPKHICDLNYGDDTLGKFKATLENAYNGQVRLIILQDGIVNFTKRFSSFEYAVKYANHKIDAMLYETQKVTQEVLDLFKERGLEVESPEDNGDEEAA